MTCISSEILIKKHSFFMEDVLVLIGIFESHCKATKEMPSLKLFSDIWRRGSFPFMFDYVPRGMTIMEFTVSLFRTLLIHFLENPNSLGHITCNSGLFYTLYMLYFTQPLRNNRIPIPISLFEMDRLANKIKLIGCVLQNLDVIFSLNELLDNQALNIAAYPQENFTSDGFEHQKILACTKIITAFADNFLKNDVPYLKAVCASYAHARLSFWTMMGKKFFPIANTLIDISLSLHRNMHKILATDVIEKEYFSLPSYSLRLTSIICKDIRMRFLKTICPAISVIGLSDRVDLDCKVAKNHNVNAVLLVNYNRMIRREIHRRDLALKLTKLFFTEI
eukprot:gnl/MRDRNA2_/MRDRNA2_85092_c0_seq1.p1 gnl/MRDRNA2_/MRDRNA2_85092_c0~~gnl/MRDRNA2_/MRDRNA2_85092_c0_seq1.p1  ORF type:complete len:335 (+),score=-30.47 gnl/MRDRNA2_/MRDRNA2_85092_c0_seq1:203-1207(+)